MQILITGANRGIGQALADGYRARGDSVLATARDESCDIALDVTNPTDHTAMAQALEGRAIDLLVCNAGVYLDKGHAIGTGYDAQLWADTFAVNVTGVFLTITALLDNLRLSKQPKIAVISSTMASDTNAPGGSYIYRASKAAVLNLGRNMAVDLKPEGIAVGIYHPGWVQTDMGGSAASITVDQARDGLMARFDGLDLAKTGSFETWDGQPHVF